MRLPSHVTREARLEEGACVSVEIEEGSIKVTPTRKRFKLADLLAGHASAKETRASEVDWGEPKGDEAW